MSESATIIKCVGNKVNEIPFQVSGSYLPGGFVKNISGPASNFKGIV